MEIIAVILSFVLYALYVLLPMIPAILIYRLFPDTKVGIKGPLGNLTMKASGAFAAYIIVVLLGFFLIQNTHEQITDMVHSSQTIIGYVHDGNGRALEGVVVRHLPPSASAVTDKSGEFRLENITIYRIKGKLSEEIKITGDGYVPTPTLMINEENSKTEGKNIRVEKPFILLKGE